ncbi:MAG: hypothetical protein A4E42_01701 [Methanoregulaceae archaeon PtaU1.Bin222]|nr:MAG: hypothetical protein A4E42_01701 [Methanoregulaceae archaeon PtaU1.Bin222]
MCRDPISLSRTAVLPFQSSFQIQPRSGRRPGTGIISCPKKIPTTREIRPFTGIGSCKERQEWQTPTRWNEEERISGSPHPDSCANTESGETASRSSVQEAKSNPETFTAGSVSARAWKMSDKTRRWVTFNHMPDEQASLLRQITEAEEERKMRYFISVPGCFYEIEYGLVKGRGRGSATA